MTNEKKQPQRKNSLLHTLRSGAVQVQIREQKSNCGYCYASMELRRIYVSGSGKESFGSGFFAENQRDIIRAVTEAAEWIREKQQSDAQIKNQTDTPQEGDENA